MHSWNRKIQNLSWKPSGSLIAFLFRTNKKLGTIVIHNVQQLHNYFLFIYGYGYGYDYGSFPW